MFRIREDGKTYYLPTQDEGEELDVVAFIAAVSQYNFDLVTRGIADGLGVEDWAAPQGKVLS